MRADAYYGRFLIGVACLLCSAPFVLLEGSAGVKALLTGQAPETPVAGFWWPVVVLVIAIVYVFELDTSLLVWISYRANREFVSRPRRLMFSEDHILIEEPNLTARYEWGLFRAGVEGSREFILVHDKSYTTVPKRYFENPTDVDAFRRLLQHRLGDFRQKLRILGAVPL